MERLSKYLLLNDKIHGQEEKEVVADSVVGEAVVAAGAVEAVALGEAVAAAVVDLRLVTERVTGDVPIQAVVIRTSLGGSRATVVTKPSPVAVVAAAVHLRAAAVEAEAAVGQEVQEVQEAQEAAVEAVVGVEGWVETAAAVVAHGAVAAAGTEAEIAAATGEDTAAAAESAVTAEVP